MGLTYIGSGVRIGSDGARIRSNRVRIGSLGTGFLLITLSSATDAVSLTAALQPYPR